MADACQIMSEKLSIIWLFKPPNSSYNSLYVNSCVSYAVMSRLGIDGSRFSAVWHEKCPGLWQNAIYDVIHSYNREERSKDTKKMTGKLAKITQKCTFLTFFDQKIRGARAHPRVWGTMCPGFFFGHRSIPQTLWPNPRKSPNCGQKNAISFWQTK
jgi:hypothetical protein